MSHDEIIQYAIDRTHFKARQLIGRHGFKKHDQHDLEQDLLADVVQRLPKFDGSRAGAKTFVSRIIDHRIANLIKRQTAACRDYRRQCSLDDWVRDEDGQWVPRHMRVDVQCLRAHVGEPARSDKDACDLALDTAGVVQSLPHELRELCQRLQSQSVSEISRQTGVSRTCLYERIKLIRRRFVEADMHQYV